MRPYDKLFLLGQESNAILDRMQVGNELPGDRARYEAIAGEIEEARAALREEELAAAGEAPLKPTASEAEKCEALQKEMMTTMNRMMTMGGLPGDRLSLEILEERLLEARARASMERIAARIKAEKEAEAKKEA